MQHAQRNIVFVGLAPRNVKHAITKNIGSIVCLNVEVHYTKLILS